jgi:hypothetical protein
MGRIVTTIKKICAFIGIALSTLSSYAKIVRIVIRERLWWLPQRELRSAAGSTRRAP